MKTKLSTIILLFSIVFCVHAQQTENVTQQDTVVGLIINQKGKAVKDVPVSIRSINEAVKTDKKGIFVLPNISLQDTLNLFLPKSKIVQVPISGLNFLKITIKDDNYYSAVPAKDEIVHIGYGTVKKARSTTGDVVISGDELRRSGNDILSALMGKVPGLRITYKDDGTPSVTMRGGSSVNLDDSPLYIVDGVTIENLNFVNINDVEKVTIMKEANMYGVKGANGAIVVTTK